MKEIITEELLRIAKRHDGMLCAEDVVEAARPSSSPLHDRFTWDNSEAAHLWRLEEARKLIRVSIETLKTSKGDIPIRVFVSLKSDRILEGGGYRTSFSVLNDTEMRDQLLNDAYNDMESFQRKYNSLQELHGIFIEMDRIKLRVKA